MFAKPRNIFNQIENISLDDKRHLLWEKKLKMDKSLKKERIKIDKESWKENGLFNLDGLYKILDENMLFKH